MNNIKFKHEFEVIDFNDELSTEFDVLLLGVGILPKLNIHLIGVTFKWPDSERENKLQQFEDINHDIQNKYNPEKATRLMMVATKSLLFQKFMKSLVDYQFVLI